MFRSSTIIRELALNLAKVIFMSKHLVKLNRYYCAVVWQHVMEWCVCCMLCRMQLQSHSAQHATHTPFHDMLPHNRTIITMQFHRMF